MILDIEKYKNTPVITAPYKYLVVEDFIKAEHLAQLLQEFPEIIARGSFPLSALKIDEFFGRFIDEFFTAELKQITAEKFALDLQETSGMITLRGHTGKEDGQIHRDSKGKVVTFLLYMNGNWAADQGGNLRVLNSQHNIEDFVCEVTPKAGTLVVFECADNAWHGHLPFVGARQSLQFNYVKNSCYLTYEKCRHRFSAFIKRVHKCWH